MRYRVVTRWSPLNVRTGPGLRFRAVSQLPRGAVVEVLETVQNDDGIWYRVANGWASYLYLEPLSQEPPVMRQPERQRVPSFLRFDLRMEIDRLERQKAVLTERIERAERLAYEAGQVAAQHGSRLYEMDPASRALRDIENLPRALGVEGDDPGVRGLETAQDVRIRRELEQLAAQRENEVRHLQRELAQVNRELDRLRREGRAMTR